jgi:hypothetical protein
MRMMKIIFCWLVCWPYRGDSVDRKVVHHYYVAPLEFWNKTFFEVGYKVVAFIGPSSTKGATIARLRRPATRVMVF